MTIYKPGDVILVEFHFSDSSGSKKRPAVVINDEEYHKRRHDLMVLAITTNVARNFLGDTPIEKWKEAGLLYPSSTSGVIRTIHEGSVIRKFGTLSEGDFDRVKTDLRQILQL